MEYLTVQETANRWNLSKRTVQQLCVDGRLPGAQKIGRSWAIPADAEKPQDPRLTRLKAPEPPAETGLPGDLHLMPLMNSAFPPGRCRETVEAMAEGPQRDIALAEYHYFSGKPEAAAKEAEAYLVSENMSARLSAHGW